MAQEERIALFFDYENLAISARDDLGVTFDAKPIADALAERGRVVVRRAYADWSNFDDDRRMLTRNHVELIEIPQRLGMVRKNAADIKMAVDAIEFAFEREYLTTFVICTGDSDFSPLVHKLRELDRRVIGVGIEASTSNLLPPACDEFLFYESLDGVDLPKRRTSRKDSDRAPAQRSVEELEKLVTRTVGGLLRSSSGPVLASTVKRALLRKDPTFSETEYGFRAFGELLRHLEEKQVITLSEGPAKGDPEVELAEGGKEEGDAFRLLVDVASTLQKNGPVALSGLKDQLRKRDSEFSEKLFGYNGFLQFVRAADNKGIVNLTWDDDLDGYRVETN